MKSDQWVNVRIKFLLDIVDLLRTMGIHANSLLKI